jgi:hypothetical protein
LKEMVMPEANILQQNPGSPPTRDPDRLIKWFIGVVLTGVGVNLLSGLVLEQQWSWLPPMLFVGALLVTVPRTGLLRRERHGATRWARAMALLALTGYLAVAVRGSMTRWPIAVMILSVAFLWGAGVGLTWSTLRSRVSLGDVALGTACLLVGSAFLRNGVAVLLAGSTLDGIGFLLLGVGGVLFGVTNLLHGSAVAGTGLLLGGLGVLLFGVAFLLNGSPLGGVAFELLGIAILLLGAAILLTRRMLGAASCLLLGVASLLAGVAALPGGSILGPVAFLLLGVAGLLLGVSILRGRPTLCGVAFLLFGVAFPLFGFLNLLDATLLGVALLLLGVAFLLGGVLVLYRPELSRQLLAWLTQR